MNLRNKLQFFTSGGGGKLTVILPEEFSIINSDKYFTAEVKNANSDVGVYIDSTLLGYIVVSGGNGSSVFKIPKELYTIGTIYKVEDGTETQISNPKKSILCFKDNKNEAEIYVYLNWTNNSFEISSETTATFWKPEVNMTKDMNISATQTATFEIIT